ncbi:MAG: hypothetical protein CVV27_11625 [Candidatus Melainabacteria bacterium HGW-Melainabacteria-1]|nr:MAG: hypothetical protein CVV27_11625 [Candidatus Melainabacteria bacterium HGW-Melainabacteria-1]
MSVVPFAAPAWLKSGHQQTLYAALGHRPAPLAPDRRIKIQVDAENSVLCLFNQAGAQAAQICLILLHGLESHGDAPYIVSTARKALADGFDVLRMNLRACGGSGHLARTSYHAGLSQDAWEVARYAADSLGYPHIALAGFSLGGHTLLKLAGELGTDRPDWLLGVCAVSPPLDLAASSQSLMRPANRIYERYFYQSMVRSYRAKRRLWPELTPNEPLQRALNLYAFDEHITAPAFGYRDAADYYQQNSALQFIPRISLPVTIVFALDDPIIPFASHQQAMALGNPQLHWLLSAEGGHVGFRNDGQLAASDRDAHWAENRLLETVASWQRQAA